MNNVAMWAKGEARAKEYLLKQGYKILETNYKTKIGELDLVAETGNTIVFVEVKARNSVRFGLPREAVTPHKQNRIRQLAMQYARTKKLLNRPLRFDVIELLGDELTHIPNAF